MANTDVLRVTLRYAQIKELFERPDVSPFSADFHEYSLLPGVEYIAKELSANPSLKRVDVTILLPSARITPDLERQACQAINRYCLAHRRMLQQDARALRWRSTRALAVALAVLFVAVWLGGLVGNSMSFIPQIIGDSLVFGSWVAIWFPLDSLVFGAWQIHLESRDYQRLADARIIIRPADRTHVAHDEESRATECGEENPC